MTMNFNDTDLLRAKYQKNYANARANLLLATILTVASVIMVVVADYLFYFSALIPVIIAVTGREFQMMTNGSYTAADLGLTAEEYELMQTIDGNMILIVCLVIALLITAVYFLCWLLSKKRPAWMIVALVLYSVDTFFALPEILGNLAVDPMGAVLMLLFHAWMLYYLISGLIASSKLKKLPAAVEGEAVVIPETEGIPVAADYPEAAAAEETPAQPEEVPANTDGSEQN